MLKFRKKLAEKKEASKGIAKAGFTLIELLVVIAILAILVLLAAPRFLGYTKDATVRAMQADAKVLANSALIHNIEKESWPTNGTSGTITIDEVEVNYEKFNEAAIKSHVQTLKGKFTDYALVTEKATIGTETLEEGDVVFIGKDKKDVSGVEDKDGNRHFSVNVKVAKPAKPAEGLGQ